MRTLSLFILGFLSVITLVMPISTAFGEELNAGFVQGLWFSEEPIFAGEPTRIYIALRNNADDDLTGTVRFYADDVLIGTKSISAIAGRLIEVWTDWTPAYGEHTISASLTKVQLHKIGEGSENAEVTSSLAKGTVFVDYDTDKDATGNTEDTDDDNDGRSDVDEKTAGTDPLVANTPETPKASESTSEQTTNQSGTPSNTDDKATTTAPKETERGGFETILKSDSIAKSSLTTITETIQETKQSLDAYREEREAAKETSTQNTPSSAGNLASTSISSGSSMATITRTMLPKEKNFANTALDIGEGLVGGLYTVALGILSFLLGFPALIELILLLFILSSVFMIARRLGGRRYR